MKTFISSEAGGKVYRILFEIDDQQFQAVVINTLKRGSFNLQYAQLHLDSKLFDVLQDNQAQLLKNSVSAYNFLLDLAHITNKLYVRQPQPDLEDLRLQLVVVNELERVQYKHVVDVDLKSRLVSLRLNGIDFIVKYSLLNNKVVVCGDFLEYSQSGRTYQYEPSENTLQNIISDLEQQLGDYAEYLAVKAELCDCFNARQTSLDTQHGLISLPIGTDGCQLQLQISVQTPRMAPNKVSVLGPEKKSQQLTNQWAEKCHQWDQSQSFRKNLISIFPQLCASEIQSVGYTQSQQSQSQLECSICYTNVEEASVAQQFSCDSCQKVFHRECIVEWCQALASTRITLHRMFSSCPNCKSSIIVTVQ
ncbi:hypothetical protein MIR68_004779 [Amoeboaphelidium protococcarum]|nr:hypothetical protein MIR68_004779 [Amoeboaphelidium protococcarum]